MKIIYPKNLLLVQIDIRFFTIQKLRITEQKVSVINR